jgi:predicted dehydrogenase
VLSIGVIGLGAISSYYLDALRSSPDAKLAAVCDSDPARLAEWSDEQVTATGDYRCLFDLADLDAVIVSTPNDRHAEICDAAIEAGRHVCCEKPLVSDTSTARVLEQKAFENGVVLFTAFHRRYNRNVRALATRVRAEGDRHGGIRVCRVRYRERIEDHCGSDAWYLEPARSGGGCLADNGPNALDAARVVVGDLAIESVALEVDQRGIDIRATLELTAARAPRVVVELDWAYDRGEQKDIELELADGTRLYGDMLAGYPLFKSSLGHEYEGIVEDFESAARAGVYDAGTGLANIALIERGYEIAGVLEQVPPDD